MIEIAFVGWCVEDNELKSFPAASVAGNKYQNGLLKAFNEDYFHVHRLVFPTYASFPKSNKIVVTSSVLPKKENRSVCSFINIPIIKQITTSISLFLNLMKWSKKYTSAKRCVVVYNLYSYRDIALRLFCKIKKIPRILAIADVTEKGNGFWKDIEYRAEKKHIKDYDALIPITDKIQADFAPTLPYYRIEGGISDVVVQTAYKSLEKKERVVVYTGALNQYSNIEVLLDAFMMINNRNYRLIIAGTGPLENIVMDRVKKDDRILYLGQIPNIEAVELQRKADILVCPRLPDNFVTKYTFPSKIMEYLVTGNAVVSFPLEGIPKEYFDYLYIPEQCSADALKKTLESCYQHDINERKAQLEFISTKYWGQYSNGIYALVSGILI